MSDPKQSTPTASAETERSLFGEILDWMLAPLLGWLRTHVHGLGALRSTRELLVAATGRPLDPAVFLAHLERRYLG